MTTGMPHHYAQEGSPAPKDDIAPSSNTVAAMTYRRNELFAKGYDIDPKVVAANYEVCRIFAKPQDQG
jgi:hypothetical protein